MKGKLQYVFTAMFGVGLTIVGPGSSAPSGKVIPAQMVITVVHRGSDAQEKLEGADVTVKQGRTPVPVLSLQRLEGDLAEMQLFVLLDDSTRSSSLDIQLSELRTFFNSLPVTTQVAVGYMHNGTFALSEAFTADHQQAAHALRSPEAIPRLNGSPYFVLSDLAKHWPSKQSTGRRVVLMLTDGVDPYYEENSMDDPYIDEAVEDTLKNGVAVYSIYLSGAGGYSGSRRVTIAQSHLVDVSQKTGGYAYFLDFTDPVTIAPFLKDFHRRLENQCRLAFEARNKYGVQPIELRTGLHGLKIDGPSRIYVQ